MILFRVFAKGRSLRCYSKRRTGSPYGAAVGVTIDWIRREKRSSQIKVMVKGINKYCYPPELQEAVQTLLKRAGLLCAEWVRAAVDAGTHR